VPDPLALAVLEAVVDDEDDGEEFEASLELFEPQALKAIMPATARDTYTGTFVVVIIRILSSDKYWCFNRRISLCVLSGIFQILQIFLPRNIVTPVYYTLKKLNYLI